MLQSHVTHFLLFCDAIKSLGEARQFEFSVLVDVNEYYCIPMVVMFVLRMM